MGTIFSCLANDSCLEYDQPKAPHFLGYLLDKRFGNGFHPIPGKTATGFDVAWLRKDGSLATHPMHKVEESFGLNPLIYQKNAIDEGKAKARIASDILYSFYEALERRVKLDMVAHMLALYLIEGYIKENTLRTEELYGELRYSEIDQGDLLVWFHNRDLPKCRFDAAKMRVMYHEFDPLDPMVVQDPVLGCGVVVSESSSTVTLTAYIRFVLKSQDSMTIGMLRS